MEMKKLVRARGSCGSGSRPAGIVRLRSERNLLPGQQVFEALILCLLADLNDPHRQLFQVSCEGLALVDDLLGLAETALLKTGLPNQERLREQ